MKLQQHQTMIQTQHEHLLASMKKIDSSLNERSQIDFETMCKVFSQLNKVEKRSVKHLLLNVIVAISVVVLTVSVIVGLVIFSNDLTKETMVDSDGRLTQYHMTSGELMVVSTANAMESYVITEIFSEMEMDQRISYLRNLKSVDFNTNDNSQLVMAQVQDVIVEEDTVYLKTNGYELKVTQNMVTYKDLESGESSWLQTGTQTSKRSLLGYGGHGGYGYGAYRGGYNRYYYD